MTTAQSTIEKPKPTKKQLELELAKLEEQLETALDPEPFVQQAEEILAKMEVDMPNGMAWLSSVKTEILKNLHVVAPSGRVRRLFRVMTGVNKSKAEAGRRAKNSPIQGLSSEVGVVAGYLSYKNCYDYTRRPSVKAKASGKSLLSKITRLVHDATYLSTPYHLLLPQIMIGLWTSTTGVAAYYEEHFGFEMAAAPEVELEICAREDVVYKWDWSIPELGKIIRKSLEDQKALGNLEGEVDDAMREIFWCWVDREELKYLFNAYPFLNVPYDKVRAEVRKCLKEQKLI